MAGMNVKAIIEGLLSLSTQELRDTNPGTIARNYSGIRQKPIFEPQVNYNLGPNEKVMRGEANTIIVQGYDRPGSIDSGTRPILKGKILRPTRAQSWTPHVFI